MSMLFLMDVKQYEKLWLKRLLMMVLCLSICLLSTVSVASKTSVSKRVYSVLTDVQAILYPESTGSNSKSANDTATSGTPDLNKAKRLVASLKMDSLSEYEQALIHQLSASIAWSEENYSGVYNATKSAWQLQVLPAKDQLMMEKRLAQVAMYLEQWQQGVAHFESWLVNRELYNQKVEVKHQIAVASDDYLLMAQGSYQAELWYKTLHYSDIARKQWRKEVGPKTSNLLKESWLQLKLGALLNLLDGEVIHKQGDRLANQPILNESQLRLLAIEELTVLAQHYPTKDYWRQLAFMYLRKVDQQSEKEAKRRRVLALASLESAYLSDLIVTEQDILWMVQLQMYLENYRRAADILATNLTSERLPRSVRNIRLLASNAMASRDYKLARQALLDVKALDPKADISESLATAETMINKVYP